MNSVLHFLIQVLGQALGTAGAAALLIWIFKSVFTHSLERDIEKLRSALATAASDHSHRFLQLHTKRAEVIERLYRSLVDTEAAFVDLTAPGHLDAIPTSQSSDRAGKAAQALLDYSRYNALYLPEKLAADLESFNSEVWKVWRIFKNSHDDNWKPIGGLEANHKWDEAWNKASSDLPKLKRRIENQFRMLLGVEDEIASKE